MDEHKFRSLFPSASPDTVRRNTVVSNGGPGPAPQLERHLGNGAVGKVQIQEPTRRRFLVRIEAVRRRLIDEDNLCEKYHVDLLRYAGIISGDEAGTTRIETTQRKADKGEEERIEIEVYELPARFDSSGRAIAYDDEAADAGY